jgi:hypothetical protein
MSQPTLISQLPKVNCTITGHYRNDGTPCPWSYARVTRLIRTCPNGCTAARVTSDEPTLSAVDVASALYDTLNTDAIVRYLGLVDACDDPIDVIKVTGHPANLHILTIELVQSGRTFTITVDETR